MCAWLEDDASTQERAFFAQGWMWIGSGLGQIGKEFTCNSSIGMWTWIDAEGFYKGACHGQIWVAEE